MDWDSILTTCLAGSVQAFKALYQTTGCKANRTKRKVDKDKRSIDKESCNPDRETESTTRDLEQWLKQDEDFKRLQTEIETIKVAHQAERETWRPDAEGFRSKVRYGEGVFASTECTST